MADIRQLERRLYDYELKMKRLSKELDRDLKKQQKQYEKSLDDLSRQMQRANEQQRKELERIYLAELRKYQNFVQERLDDLEDEMQLEINRKKRELQRLSEEVRLMEAQLKEAIGQIQNNLTLSLQEKKAIMDTCRRRYDDAVLAISKIPHRKFFPDKLESITMVELQFNQLANGEMYEALSAVLLSAEASLASFQIDCEQKAQEYRSYYDYYNQLVKQLSDHIFHMLSLWKGDYAANFNHQSKDPFYNESFNENDQTMIKEINFYSEGKFQEIITLLTKQLEIIRSIENATSEELKGIDAYLFNENSMEVSEFIQLTKKVQEALVSLPKIFYKAVDMQTTIIERKQLFQGLVDDFAEERNGIVLKRATQKADFKQANIQSYLEYKALDAKLKGDPRRAMHGVIEAGNIEIHLYIQQEDLGEHYRNVIVLYEDFKDQAVLEDAKKDNYNLMVSLLQARGIELDLRGESQNRRLFVPYLSEGNLALLHKSSDQQMVQFTNQLQKVMFKGESFYE